ncbi:MAG TPA: hypothetical protein VNT28_06145 [Candidatus Limnocylindrales bacterium]|jgi:hypothetical protein|nr:hypothetical protein [Candidatus Limnocylindrales bacterium]
MTLIRIASVEAPLNRPALLGPAVGLVRRALAVGLLRDRELVERLDMELLRGIAREASLAGIGQDAAIELLERPGPARLGRAIGRLGEALAESPLPERELAQLADVLDLDDLGELVGASPVSLRRYAAGTRAVPDAIAGRIHWLALVTADLAGAYNRLGIRRWFDRPRSQLDGRSPRQLLGRDWHADQPRVERVRQLAAALAGPGSAG